MATPPRPDENHSPTSVASPKDLTTEGNGRAPVLECTGITKVYGSGAVAVQALAGVTARFLPGEFTAVMGPSGSGKTTFLQVLAGLDSPTSGSVVIRGRDITTMSDRELTDLRRDRVGFVFQSFNLIPTLTAEQNILLPLRLARREPDPGRLDDVVRMLGVQDRLDHRPAQLSGGQQQRVAVARALLTRPDLVFADEPTGSLDLSTGSALLDQLRTACRTLGQTIVMVTHDPHAATYADRVLLLADGRIRQELRAPDRQSVIDAMGDLTPEVPRAL
ncbi:MAG: putative transport system ATP-binding protein [Actinomycetota bacterium]|nr:putative transport system ATP-binding protein [Actinomycetota bacterium]